MSSYNHYSYGGGDEEPIDSKIDRVLRNLRQLPDEQTGQDYGYLGGKRRTKSGRSTKKSRTVKRRKTKTKTKTKKRTGGRRRTGRKKTKRGGDGDGIEYF